MHTKPHWQGILMVAVVIGIAVYISVLISLGIAAPIKAVYAARFVSLIGLVVFLLWLGFEKWGWAWLPENWTHRPNLNGIWTGTGHLTFARDRDLTKEPVTLDVKITIKQTYATVTLIFWSKSSNDQRETTSEAYVDLLQRTQSGKYVLQYLFTTDPGAFAPNQPGCATLTLLPDKPQRLVGEWVFNPNSPTAGRLDVSKQ